jgi:hypothetical protein
LKKITKADERGLTTFFELFDQTCNVPADGSLASTAAYIDELAKAALADARTTPAGRNIANRCRKLVKKVRSSSDPKVAFELGDWSRRLQFEIGPEGEKIRMYDNSNKDPGGGRKNRHAKDKVLLDDRDKRIKDEAKKLIAKDRTNILDLLVESFSLEEFPLKRDSIRKLLSQARRELRAGKPGRG